MSDLRQSLKSEFQSEDYRYAYAESFLNTKLAAQIKVLREARGKTQAEMGSLIGTKQSGFSRFEDVNHRVWKTDTLWKIARALGVRLDVSFETFGSLIDQKERFNRQFLERPDFANDPAFSANTAAHSAEQSPSVRKSVYVGENVFIRNRPVTSIPPLPYSQEESKGEFAKLGKMIDFAQGSYSKGVKVGTVDAWGRDLDFGSSQINIRQPQRLASAWSVIQD